MKETTIWILLVLVMCFCAAGCAQSPYARIIGLSKVPIVQYDAGAIDREVKGTYDVAELRNTRDFFQP